MNGNERSPVILIAEDDPDERASLRALLELKNLKVVEASSAQEGLKVIRESSPDLIILDIMMETKNAGFDLAYQLRKDPELRKIPIILLSNLPNIIGEVMNPEKEERYLPVERFLTKPINPDLLFQEIERILGVKLTG